jgi:hypothetical protein
MQVFASAIDLYYASHRSYPASLQSLTQTDRTTGSRWMDSIPEDPWGAPYEYRVLGPRAFEIRSAGEDGSPGTDDDLVWPPAGE